MVDIPQLVWRAVDGGKWTWAAHIGRITQAERRRRARVGAGLTLFILTTRKMLSSPRPMPSSAVAWTPTIVYADSRMAPIAGFKRERRRFATRRARSRVLQFRLGHEEAMRALGDRNPAARS